MMKVIGGGKVLKQDMFLVSANLIDLTVGWFQKVNSSFAILM